MPDKVLRAGAASLDITPKLGVSLCGSMLDRQARNIHDDLRARSLVLDNGVRRIALVVLDLFAASKGWLAQIKHAIHGHTGIAPADVLICCTHTHSGPTTVPVFQSKVEEGYLKWAGPRVADAVRVAVERLQPARVGWSSAREERAVFNRRFFMQADTKLASPFGGEDKVLMNPGVENPAIVKAAGPVDPELAVLAVRRADRKGTPLAAFASYALHYVGGLPTTDISADYFGAVCERLIDLTGGPRLDARQPFVGMLANACSGDINNIDVRKRYAQPYLYYQMFAVADLVARGIHDAWSKAADHDWVELDVRETSVELEVRKPDLAEVAGAREVLANAPQGPLRAPRDIYARETIQLADWPEKFTTPVQALRVGELALCALPGEPFCQLGLDIKAKSPFKQTMLIGLANDYAGYVPTAEQFALGGYETWRARSSFVEPKAADKLQKAALELLTALKG